MLRSHREVFFHAVEREIPEGKPVRLLVDGVQNGGGVEAWRASLPEGSVVVAVDAVGSRVPGVIGCDFTSPREVFVALGWMWFDVVICPWRHAPLLWPYLTPGGKAIMESAERDVMECAVMDLWDGHDGWLPVEEMMRVGVYEGVLVVEKRNPKVIPYLNVAAGVDSPFVERDSLVTAGTLVVTANQDEGDSVA